MSEPSAPAPPPAPAAVAVLRRFNRTWSQRVGVLDESFLGSGRAAGPSRLLFEIGSSPDAPTVRSLRDRVGLDSGYLSRLLGSLESEGLIRTEVDPADRRRRVVRLTDAGTAAYDELDLRSDEVAERLVEPLTARQRERLTGALATADLLVRAATVEVREVSPVSAQARAAQSRYFAELVRRFPGGFDPGVPDDAGTFLLATSGGAPVAYGGVVSLSVGPAAGAGEIKRMWVHEEWRGAGLGSRMLRELEALAARLGHARIVLDTHLALGEAVAMYERAGYLSTERYNDNPYAQAWFAKRLAPTDAS